MSSKGGGRDHAGARAFRGWGVGGGFRVDFFREVCHGDPQA